MAATRTKLDPQGLYRCVEPFSFGGDDGVPIALNRETGAFQRVSFEHQH